VDSTRSAQTPGLTERQIGHYFAERARENVEPLREQALSATVAQQDDAERAGEQARLAGDRPSQEPQEPGPPSESVVDQKSRQVNVDRVVISLAAKGLANAQISAHLKEAYDETVSPQAVARITDRVLDELTDWQTRPLDLIYPVIFIDAMVVKIRDGKVANRPVHTAVGVDVEGHRNVLGLWVGEGAEGAKYWHQVLTEIANRGVDDVCFVICDGLKGLSEVVNDVWPQAIVQTCVIHLIRNSIRYASRTYVHRIMHELRPIYTAPTEQAAKERFVEFSQHWGERYPAIIRLWENAWPEFVPFLAYSPDIREVIYSSNAIENLHSRLRHAVRAHGYFQTEQAALKCLYLAIRSFDPKGLGQIKWSGRWKPALNAFAITFEGRFQLTSQRSHDELGSLTSRCASVGGSTRSGSLFGSSRSLFAVVASSSPRSLIASRASPTRARGRRISGARLCLSPKLTGSSSPIVSGLWRGRTTTPHIRTPKARCLSRPDANSAVLVPRLHEDTRGV
jgi:putative transposase